MKRSNGSQEILEVNESTSIPFKVIVRIGDLMQWQANENSDLLVYEICFPPYEDGIFENVEEY